jgi:murein L,D-transpeptidase YcbB/YkuD
MRKNLSILLTLGIASLALACNRNEPLPPAVPQLVKETVEAQTLPASVRDQKERVRAWEEMRGFYQKRQFQPAWSGPKGPLPQAGELIQALGALAAEGIDPSRYQLAELEALSRGVAEIAKEESFDDPQAQRRLVDLDVELTYAFLTAASHLATGRLQPEKLRVDWYAKPRNVDLDARLEQALTQEGAIAAALRGLTPPHEDYARLRQALRRHREIAARGGWPAVPPGEDLEEGARGGRVRALRARLGLPAQADAFDPAVTAAVRRFQQRHGLEVTGTVDEETLAELNVPVADRIRQIQVNLERWRWMPATLGERYIAVNIPEFRLDLVEPDGRTAMTMRVVVGKEQSRTPAFSDQMTYLELNPAWNLPSSIANEEVLPKLASNPGYLASQDMEVVRGWGDGEEVVDASSVDWSQLGKEYRLRQRPGAANPLGKVKFMFPNEFDVYLHDTPADHLFSRTERDFSHGCIRLEKPIELAEYLLRDDPKWTPEAIRAAIDSGAHDTIKLPRPIAVHLLYWTAWVEKDGTVQFRKDVYGHDARLEEALAEEPPLRLNPAAVRGEVRAAR